MIFGNDLKIRLIIDPHTSPGAPDPYTFRPTDPFWTDFKYHDLLIDMWKAIARNSLWDYGDVVAGYDLLNEPAVPDGGAPGTPADWNLLVRKLAAAIRAIDDTHTLVVKLHGSRHPRVG